MTLHLRRLDVVLLFPLHIKAARISHAPYKQSQESITIHKQNPSPYPRGRSIPLDRTRALLIERSS